MKILNEFQFRCPINTERSERETRDFQGNPPKRRKTESIFPRENQYRHISNERKEPVVSDLCHTEGKKISITIVDGLP